MLHTQPHHLGWSSRNVWFEMGTWDQWYDGSLLVRFTTSKLGSSLDHLCTSYASSTSCPTSFVTLHVNIYYGMFLGCGLNWGAWNVYIVRFECEDKHKKLAMYVLARYYGVAPQSLANRAHRTKGMCKREYQIIPDISLHLSQVISHWVACEVLGKFMTRFCKFGKMVFKVYFGQIRIPWIAATNYIFCLKISRV